MVQTLITPDGADWDHVSADPTPSERYVAAWFEERLPEGWEIYIRPYLNGPTPSLVLLHPKFGIAVYEVVDWDPSADQFTVRSFAQNDTHVLLANDKPLEGLDNPYQLIRHYKSRIASLCTDVIGPTAYGLITAGLIFTQSSTRYWEGLLNPFRKADESKSMYPVLGQDVLNLEMVERVLPRASRNTSRVKMTTQVADLLRSWLLPVGMVDINDDPFDLDPGQLALVNQDPGATGYRRVKGPAGSGKSVILAARAARLALAGRRVLMTCFNITMRNYLRKLLERFLWANTSNQEEVDRAYRRVEIHHYHEWAYQGDNDCLSHGVCKCSASAKFNAVMVDEGQDFEPDWWSHLRLCALEDGGEVLFAADATQDLYGRAKSWTDNAMINAGFRGPWNTLGYNYRVPAALLPMLKNFVASFMPDRVSELPTVAQGELSDQYPVSTRWVQLPSDGSWGSICLEELQRTVNHLPNGHFTSDVAFLCWDHEHGFEFVTAMSRLLSVDVSHIFVEPSDDDIPGRNVQSRSRTLKRAFPLYEDALRAITTHSYKGWEARHLLIYVDDISSDSDGWSGAALFYVALTRLMRDPSGSSLTVVSSCPMLADFGRRYFADYETRIS